MKKKYLFAALSSALLLVSCGGNGSSSSAEASSASANPEASSSSSETVSSSQSSSSTASASNDSSIDSTDYLAIIDQTQSLYSIRLDYRMTNSDASTVYASGFSRMRVYSGVDSDGAEVKIRHYQGQDSYLSSLDDNPVNSSSSYSVYYTPTRTYTLQENGSYAITSETHEDSEFQAMDLGFDYSKAASYEHSMSGYNHQLTFSFADDSAASAFLNEELGSAEAASGISDLSFSISMNSSYVPVSALATYSKKGYSYRASWTYSSLMSTLTLPS